MSACSSTCPSSTSWPWTRSTRSSSWTRRSCSTCKTLIPRTGSPIGTTSTQFWTRAIQSTSQSSLPTLRSKGTPPQGKPTSRREWTSQRSGGTTSTACRTYPVSTITSLTQEGSKGRTLQLLKECSKPVPVAKKRRKIEALPRTGHQVPIPRFG